jgi:spermidine/putrescine transport system permease protein
MNTHAPLALAHPDGASGLLFLYAPIVVLIVFSFNASRTNIVFEGVVNQGPCGPFYWYCQLFRNRDVMEATRNTLMIAITPPSSPRSSARWRRWPCSAIDFPRARCIGDTLYFPIVTPEIVMGIGILVLFSARLVGSTARWRWRLTSG